MGARASIPQDPLDDHYVDDPPEDYFDVTVPANVEKLGLLYVRGEIVSINEQGWARKIGVQV